MIALDDQNQTALPDPANSLSRVAPLFWFVTPFICGFKSKPTRKTTVLGGGFREKNKHIPQTLRPEKDTPEL